MKYLRQIDLDNLKLNAGSGEGLITVSREDFDALIEGYKPEPKFFSQTVSCQSCGEELTVDFESNS